MASASNVAATEEPIRYGFATVAEVADYLNLSRQTIYNLMDAREIKFAKFGGSRRIPWSSIQDYAQRCMAS